MTTTLACPQPVPLGDRARPNQVLGRHRKKWSRPVTNALFALAVLGVAFAWILTVRPQSLGGPAGYVMVRGVSMVPTYHTGDLVIVRKESAYTKGEVVAYRIPQGEVGAGIIVIHRVIGGGPEAGFVVQGDNNPSPDDWRPKVADMVGKAWLLLPRGGTALAFLHAPLPLASLATGVAVALLVSGGGKRKKGDGSSNR